MNKLKNKINKVLILGSGGLRIGQAGEFDYSGSQAIKALKEEGITSVLVNPNIATIQTDKEMADTVYLQPLLVDTVTKIIEKERPDGILANVGGQTALNLGLELHQEGVLDKYNVKLLGTPLETIKVSEDRSLFKKALKKINVSVAKSKAVTNIKDALKAAKEIGYPVMMRAGFSLGGLGSGKINDEKTLKIKAQEALHGTSQILIEEYLSGWKEVEYEVVRDSIDTTITVCNMENLNPMGIHTGESIVVAPSQTLTDKEYHLLREVALKTIRHLGVIGECNIQYALNPKTTEYRVIEINARLSRSSALASKATGFPLAFIATKLAIGYNLHELKNSITQKTSAFFEPALDYIVVKIPRWDINKLKAADCIIGSEMKSVGEVMGIGRSFPEALQKAIRMLNIGADGISSHPFKFSCLKAEIASPSDKHIFALYEYIKSGGNIDTAHVLTNIDKWFLHQLFDIVETEKKLTKINFFNQKEKVLNNANANINAKANASASANTNASASANTNASASANTNANASANTKTETQTQTKTDAKIKDTLLNAKLNGFSDAAIATIQKTEVDTIRDLRIKHSIIPYVKQIDTLAGEFDAETNYLYLTYHGSVHDVTPSNPLPIIILGSGPYCIGSSVEFDWCAVNTAKTLREKNEKTILINSNPETVSTDYDESDRLYFEELTLERVRDIADFENSKGIILSVGGQIANNLAMPLFNSGYSILGTSPKHINMAENRKIFSSMLNKLNIDQPDWQMVTTFDNAKEFANAIGYPLLVRPSYVLSGAAMNIVKDETELSSCLQEAAILSNDYPVVISKFIENAKEIEIDGVAQNGEIVIEAITEHIENAGIHSGDATIVLPPQRLYLETIRQAKKITRKITKAFHVTGPFNIQFIAKSNTLKVIEGNIRASRSFPFVSKVCNINFINIAAEVLLGTYIPKHYETLELDYVGIKSPLFSYNRLKGANPVAHVEMASTGEVACLGENLLEAFYSSRLATEEEVKDKKLLVSIGGGQKIKLLNEIKALETQGWEIYSTAGTHAFLSENGVGSYFVYKASDGLEPNVSTIIANKDISLIVNIPRNSISKNTTDGYLIRRLGIDHHIPLITNLQIAKLFLNCLATKKRSSLPVRSWNEYMDSKEEIV